MNTNDLDNIWTDLVDEVTRTQEAFGALVARERRLFGDRVGRQSISGHPFSREASYPEHELEKVAKDLIGNLIREAEHQFSAAGALSIPERPYVDTVDWREVRRAAAPNQGNAAVLQAARNFRPSSVWQRLEADYGEQGRDLECAQAAEVLRRMLIGEHRPAMKQVKGRVGLEVSIWLDDIAKKWDKINKPTIGSQESMRKLIHALHVFDEWSELEIRQALVEMQRGVGQCGREGITSRDEYGERTIAMQWFASKVVLWMRPDVAERLNEFIGIYQQKTAA